MEFLFTTPIFFDLLLTSNLNVVVSISEIKVQKIKTMPPDFSLWKKSLKRRVSFIWCYLRWIGSRNGPCLFSKKWLFSQKD